MNRFLLPATLSALACASLMGVYYQHQHLDPLRFRQRELIARASTAGGPVESLAPALRPGASIAPASTEIMKARNEINQLTRRKKELAGAQAENTRLRAQVAESGTNQVGSSSGKFLRRTEAKMMGYNTPEHALETLMWAVQNRNIDALLEGFLPEIAAQIKQHQSDSGNTEDFFKEAEGLVGYRIVDRKQMPDGSIEMNVLVAPEEHPQPIRFRQFGGQWKIGPPR